MLLQQARLWLMILTAFSVNEDTPSFELTRLFFWCHYCCPGGIFAPCAAYRAGAFCGVNAFGTHFSGNCFGLIILTLHLSEKMAAAILFNGGSRTFNLLERRLVGFLTMCLSFTSGIKRCGSFNPFGTAFLSLLFLAAFGRAWEKHD